MILQMGILSCNSKYMYDHFPILYGFMASGVEIGIERFRALVGR